MSNDLKFSEKMRVFLCHSSGDKAPVRALNKQLLQEGIDPWLDEEKLVGGEDWDLEIRKAVRSSHIVLACLSQASITKRGFVQKEIKFALDVADEQPEGDIFLIPVKLEECELPKRLRRWHCINLFDEQGYERLMKAIRRRADSLGISITKPQTEHSLYDRKRILAWDWSGVDIRKGSQGITRETDSIQFRVIQELRKRKYRIIFDDDGSGEAADIVTIRITEKSDKRKIIEVEFYFCRYSGARQPGSRMADLYEVCGLAQKTILWMQQQDKQAGLFSHLLRREPRRFRGQELSRFERGNQEELIMIREMSRSCPLQFKVFIVQPGLSKAEVTVGQLELLTATEEHLMRRCKSPLGVIAST
jgi:hypothetical protein